MKRVLTICLLAALAACGEAEDDRILGSWAFDGDEGREVTTFRRDGTVTNVRPDGDTLSGFYTFVNRNTVKLDVVHDGDSLAYLWQLTFRDDSLIVGLPNNESVSLSRVE